MHGTFSRPMKILASVITVVVLVAGILAWSTWRKKVTAEERQQAQAQQLKKHKSEERKKAAEAAANQLTDKEDTGHRKQSSTRSERYPSG